MWDEDAFWVYNFTDRRNPTPTSPSGSGFLRVEGFQRPAYSGSHTYTVVLRPPHLTGHLAFRDTYQTDHKYCTRSGAWRIEIYRVESGTTKTVSGPAPGKSKTVESPPLPPAGVDCAGSPGKTSAQSCFVDVDLTAEDFKYNAVFLEGEVSRAAKADYVVACWLLTGDKFEVQVGSSEVTHTVRLTAAEKLRYCLTLARTLVGFGKLGTPAPVRAMQTSMPAREQAASGCRMTRLAVVLHTRKGRVVSGGRAKSQKVTASSVRYGCNASGPVPRITLTGPGKGNLRRALGKRLDIGVFRVKKSPRKSGKLSFTFGWR